jgi:thiosulfate/3-mercaptopyruvate sulfurtransferase
MPFTTLVDTGTLAGHLNDPAWAIVDCRFMLVDPGWGAREHAAGHIPGAVFASLDADLSGAPDGSNGRHPLPSVERLRDTLGRLGIDRAVQVAAYDQDGGMYASRLWWLLRWLGHDAACVVDGGFAKWTSEGRPVERGSVTRARREFNGEPRPGWTATTQDVAAVVGAPGWRLLDARAPERYRGEIEPVDRVPGHIPGAVNHPYVSNLSADGTFRSPSDLRAAFEAAGGGVPMDHVICYCGSGVTACHDLLAMQRAGLSGARLYVGSWSEWASDPSRPVERS